jgi:hypothetical protein
MSSGRLSPSTLLAAPLVELKDYFMDEGANTYIDMALR